MPEDGWISDFKNDLECLGLHPVADHGPGSHDELARIGLVSGPNPAPHLHEFRLW